MIALTATATPLVQDDIAEQLGLAQAGPLHSRLPARQHRDRSGGGRALAARRSRRRTAARCRAPAGHRLRAHAQAGRQPWPRNWTSDFPAAAYHAGLDAERRKRVQEEFLAGKIEVMVATIAFGMGIDKPDIRTVIHTALPGSLEAYYQEIGRAGRDGKPSRAILMHSYADRYTHDFFFERDYPDVSVLDTIFARLGAEPQEKGAVAAAAAAWIGDVFDKALEKLWIHGGAVVDFAENVSRGPRPLARILHRARRAEAARRST